LRARFMHMCTHCHYTHSRICDRIVQQALFFADHVHFLQISSGNGWGPLTLQHMFYK
jgi:hypothetical protein